MTLTQQEKGLALLLSRPQAPKITEDVKNVEITNVGSNYISAADADAVFSTGAAAGTAVLGNVRDNGLAAYAYIIDGTVGCRTQIPRGMIRSITIIDEND